MNRQIRQLATGLLACYLLLFVSLNYWQVGRQRELNARIDNTRAIRRQFDEPRGDIVTADGVVVATSVENPPESEFKFLRQYPTGELFANVTGYYTFGHGATQLEKLQNDVLTGSTPEQQILNLPGIITGSDDSGSVRLTLRDDLQRVARDALGERPGSVVVMDPRTGAVKAMWSYPSYDPNLIADANFATADDVIQFLTNSPGDPLLANAYQQRYMPGSTFKVITTGIALSAGVVTPATVFPDETQFVPPQTDNPIQNFGGTLCGGDLDEVFTRSCNIPFAKTALDVGVAGMIAGVADWGIGESVPVDLPRPAASTFGNADDLGQSLPALAMRGFGGEEVQMVPLHMAMVASTVANGGEMMKPFVVDEQLANDGTVLDRTDPEVWKTPITPETSLTLASMMQHVATEGTASCCLALNGGIPVAAKTGTAQLNATGEPERSHAWIVAYAPADDPQYAVAVLIQGTSAEISASTGGRLAGPVAKTVLDAALAGGG